MSKSEKNIYILFNNPFLLAPLVIEFYKNFKNVPKGILIADLILPIVLFNQSRKDLQRTDNRRTIHTFKRENERIFGLPERIKEYAKLTKLILQYLIDGGFIEIEENLSVKIKNTIECDSSLNEALKASVNLAKMFSHHELIQTFRLLGINKV